ncbi:Bud site selection protein bud4 [Puccinia graminis f. sp. tritici]|uniref:Bud site selection protein bud4 n=1 Tax=Puccinia graminis f. sp. tritici TaxID=56615 RepID=A0A5B0NE52_PUCGR|nr:Bud site selection protein bud4 [Puccinia graminis f. sp. tritici]KAA1087033.1 Bud site selection protein bud4 [Puccinia graminis f. sp. tritici]
MQRLGGPRSPTPPHTPQSSGYVSLNSLPVTSLNPKTVIKIDESIDLDETPQALVGHPSPEHQPHLSEFWQGPSTTTKLHDLASRYYNKQN